MHKIIADYKYTKRNISQATILQRRRKSSIDREVDRFHAMVIARKVRKKREKVTVKHRAEQGLDT